MRIAYIVATCALAAGIAHADPAKAPEPTATDMTAKEVARWLTFFDALVEAVVATQAECDQMAVRVSRVIDDNQGAIVVARAARDHGRRLPASAQRHMLDGVRRMSPGIDHCADNALVKAAFGKLDPDRQQ